MKLSPTGRAFLIEREGKRNKAYLDGGGVWTIGIGHTAAAGPPKPVKGMVISDAEVDALLAKDIVQYENAVNAACGPALNQNQFDAMVSLCFNIGIGGFKNSSVVRRWNAGDVNGAADAFLMWDKDNGKVVLGLTKRRELEKALFLSPVASQPAPQAPAPAPAPSQPAAPPSPPAPVSESAKVGWLAWLFSFFTRA